MCWVVCQVLALLLVKWGLGDGWGLGKQKGALKPCEIVVIHLYVVGIVPLFFLHPFLPLFSLSCSFSPSRSVSLFIFSSCRFDIHPEVSRGEIRHLWVTLITNQDRTLDFLQLARHFGYSPKSSCFPNAKRSPPKKGDENLRQCSRKLHCVSDILADGVRAKVELSLDELRAEFEELDPYRTGFVSQEEFQEVLKGLCVHLDDYEWEMLARKFDINRDGRVSFVEFLRPFGRRKQPWRHGSNMAGILQFHNETEDLSAEKGSSLCDQVPLSSRLRKKVH
ncbi:unnamed protein product [Oncorhynchus mykiss]|uniref:EF-hand domain-containing protein n=1 Tax=Oncorhynchus mykiss TaxID=8022 RepID=A0A060WA94_ONCMY|nr:unnamed protein product [Oncorhynchus mykiss]